MKRITTMLILLCCISIYLPAQGISAVMLTTKPIVMKGEPKMMKTTETNYGKSGEIKIRKTIIEFDKFSLPTSVATLNEDNTVHTVTYYKYDSLKRVELERHIEDRNVKYRTSRVHFYSTYEHDYPIIYRQMNPHNVVVSETLTKLNDEGQPIMASLYEMTIMPFYFHSDPTNSTILNFLAVR